MNEGRVAFGPAYWRRTDAALKCQHATRRHQCSGPTLTVQLGLRHPLIGVPMANRAGGELMRAGRSSIISRTVSPDGRGGQGDSRGSHQELYLARPPAVRCRR